MTRSSLLVAALAVATGLASCGADERSEPSGAAETVTANASELSLVVDQTLDVGSPKRELAIQCWGTGSPAVVLDAGSNSSGIDEFGTLEEELIKPLARRSTVCTYSRAGTGRTALLPKRRRTIDDQAQELDALLTAARVPSPRVLVGSSFGGFVVVHTAREYPARVGGIVLLDVPAGNAKLTEREAPEAAWDHRENIERVDSFHAERTMARDRRSLGDVPVRVVTATDGQSDRADQRVWKRLSSDFTQIELAGGHDIYSDNTAGVAKQILKTVDDV